MNIRTKPEAEAYLKSIVAASASPSLLSQLAERAIRDGGIDTRSPRGGWTQALLLDLGMTRAARYGVIAVANRIAKKFP